MLYICRFESLEYLSKSFSKYKQILRTLKIPLFDNNTAYFEHKRRRKQRGTW